MIKKKNKACNPAKGTVLIFKIGFKSRNKTKANNKENENNKIKVIEGKLMAIPKKNKMSPKPKASLNFIFNFKLVYRYKTPSITKMILRFSSTLLKNTSTSTL